MIDRYSLIEQSLHQQSLATMHEQFLLLHTATLFPPITYYLMTITIEVCQYARFTNNQYSRPSVIHYPNPQLSESQLPVLLGYIDFSAQFRNYKTPSRQAIVLSFNSLIRTNSLI